jgi:hypothetical protein
MRLAVDRGLAAVPMGMRRMGQKGMCLTLSARLVLMSESIESAPSANFLRKDLLGSCRTVTKVVPSVYPRHVRFPAQRIFLGPGSPDVPGPTPRTEQYSGEETVGVVPPTMGWLYPVSGDPIPFPSLMRLEIPVP